MNTQKIAEMQPLDAALAIFAALGLVHIPGEHDGWGHVLASLPTVPGATLALIMRSDSYTGRGMFRARVSDSLGHDFWAVDISGPGGNFNRAQTAEQAAKAISRRLLSQGRPEAYIAALRKRHADKHSAAANVDAVLAQFSAMVRAEAGALGMKKLPAALYREARMSLVREVSPTGAFSLSLWGDGPFPNVQLWGPGREFPVRVRIDDGRSSISFTTAAKICALVAFDKSTQD